MLFLINFISSNTDVDYQNKQELLEIDNLKQRAIKLLEILSKQVEFTGIEKRYSEESKNGYRQTTARIFPASTDEDHPGRAGCQPGRRGPSKNWRRLAETKEVGNGTCQGNFRQRSCNKLKRPKPLHPGLLRAIQLREGNDWTCRGITYSEDNLDLKNMHARYWMPIISDWRK